MLSAANAPYAQPQPGATLVSLDVFSLQVRNGTGWAEPCMDPRAAGASSRRNLRMCSLHALSLPHGDD
jgi:hypothetical protein